MKIIFIQPVIPGYSRSFFNALANDRDVTELKVYADIASQNQLNQAGHANSFVASHLPTLSFKGLELKAGSLRAVLKERPDVCIINASPRDLLMIPKVVLMRVFGVRVYFWGMFHRIGKPKFFTQLLYRTMAFVATGTIAYSTVGARNLLSLCVPPSRITIAGTAIDETVPQAAAAALSLDDLAKFKTDNRLHNRKLILQVVRLSEIKKPRLLLDLVETLLKRDVPDFVLVSIGGGDLYDEMQAEVKARQIEEHFELRKPVYDESILAKWFASASVFTIPTCMGLSTHHAMAYGIPIVTDGSLLNQASESALLADGLNAILYQEGNIEEYADAIQTILNDEALQKNMSENCKTTVYSVSPLGRKVAQFLSVIHGEH